MANVTVIAAILGVVVSVYQSFNGERNSENPQMLILSVDCRDRYSGGGVFTESWHLVILRSLVPDWVSVSPCCFSSHCYSRFLLF